MAQAGMSSSKARGGAVAIPRKDSRYLSPFTLKRNPNYRSRNTSGETRNASRAAPSHSQLTAQPFGQFLNDQIIGHRDMRLQLRIRQPRLCVMLDPFHPPRRQIGRRA